MECHYVLAFGSFKRYLTYLWEKFFCHRLMF
jgi:hypothetical protein